MSKLWTRQLIAIYAGAIILSSVAAHYIPGDMVTRFLITFPILIVVMVGGIYFLNKQAKSEQTH